MGGKGREEDEEEGREYKCIVQLIKHIRIKVISADSIYPFLPLKCMKSLEMCLKCI
jgi:hypothetical protein